MKQIQKAYEGGGVFVESYEQVTDADALALCKKAEDEGFAIGAKNRIGENIFSFYKKETEYRILSYYPSLGEAKLVRGEGNLINGLCDEGKEAICKPLLTMVDLFDFGLSLVLRLTDGRFIIFDGGWEVHGDAERLMAVLKKQCVTEKITVAAWIITHPHTDHYRFYAPFSEKYENQYTVQRFIYNIFDTDTQNAQIAGAEKEKPYLLRFFDAVKKSGASVTRAHTGEVFEIAGARFEALSTPDDTLRGSGTDVNSLSLVYKVTYMGQTILFTGDAMLPSARLAERFGEYLKSDILQVPHHMFNGGQIECYRRINPATILIPCEDEYVFSTIATRQKGTRDPNIFLLRDLGVQDCFPGGRGDIVLTLPYTPRENGRALLLADLERGDRSIGAKDWYFADITTENCTFFIVNSTWAAIPVRVDLLAEGGGSVHDFKDFTVPNFSCKTVSLAGGEGWIPELGALENAFKPDKKYVVRFRAKDPIIMKGPSEPIYHS